MSNLVLGKFKEFIPKGQISQQIRFKTTNERFPECQYVDGDPWQSGNCSVHHGSLTEPKQSVINILISNHTNLLTHPSYGSPRDWEWPHALDLFCHNQPKIGLATPGSFQDVCSTISLLFTFYIQIVLSLTIWLTQGPGITQVPRLIPLELLLADFVHFQVQIVHMPKVWLTQGQRITSDPGLILLHLIHH